MATIRITEEEAIDITKKKIDKIRKGTPEECRFLCAKYYTELPIDKKTILYESFAGRGLVCSPYAIFKHFIKREDFEDYDHVWAVETDQLAEELADEYKEYSNVRFIRRESDEYCKVLCTAGYLINNLSFPMYYTKRPGQIYINTWHGIPLKTLGFDIPDGRVTGLNTIRNFLSTDVFTSPNSFMTDVFKNSFSLDGVFEGHFYECGMPRCDCVVDTERSEIADKLHKLGVAFDTNKKTILYAPTWKGERYSQPDVSLNSYLDLIDIVEKTVDTDKYQILVKPHQIVYKHMQDQGVEVDEHFVPATIDACELLSATDVLISDYSSIYFDYLVTNKPILFYIPDLVEYQSTRGLYFGTDKLPGPIAQSVSELADLLKDTDAAMKPFKEVYERERKWACPHEDGKVCERLIDDVIAGNNFDKMDRADTTSKKKVLVYSGAVNTKSSQKKINKFIQAFNFKEYDLTVIAPGGKNEHVQDWIRLADPRVRVLRRNTTHNATASEMAALERMSGYDIHRDGCPDFFPKEAYQREAMRSVGDIPFDFAYDFSEKYGYFYNIFYAMDGVKLLTKKELKDFMLPKSMWEEAPVKPYIQQAQATPKAVPKNVKIKKNRIIVKLNLKDCDRSEIKKVFIRYRNVDSYDIDLPYENVGSNAIKIYMDADKLDLKELFWDLFLEYEREGMSGEIRPRFVNNRLKMKFYLFNRHMEMPDDHIFFPYYTKVKTFSFMYRSKSQYDGYKTKLNDIIASGIYFLFKPILDKNHTWLVYEKFCLLAQDNGYYFFKYCMENLSPKEKKHIYYVIDKNSPDYKKVAKYKKNVTKFMGLKHCLNLYRASLYVGSDARSHLYAWRPKTSLVRSKLNGREHFFLQHGVTALKDVSKTFGVNGVSASTYFATTSKFEQDIAVKYLGYDRDNAPITGFTRWDVLNDKSSELDHRMILLMPTWRSWLEEVSDDVFLESEYYHNYAGLIGSKELSDYLDATNTELIFYIHPKFADYLSNFHADSPRIRLIPMGQEPLNEIMMRCSLLITDYSSVCWDVFYQKKPVIFYQFDLDQYMEVHGSFIDMRQELFGRRAETEEEFMVQLKKCIEGGCKIRPEDEETFSRYFEYVDDRNSERTYKYLKSLGY